MLGTGLKHAGMTGRGRVSFCGCDINICFAAIAAAFDDPIVYSLAILRDVAKRERDGEGGLNRK